MKYLGLLPSLLAFACACADIEEAPEARELALAAPSDAEPSAGCRSLRPDLGGFWSVDVGGERRAFTVHIPPSYRRLLLRPTPLVLSFHGYRNFPLFQQVFSGLNHKADEAGFIVVYPKGTGDPLSFNGQGCCGSAFSDGVDDVAFTDAMLDELERKLCIDKRRVYVTGFSNGGFMAQRLACERAERFAAAASVGGLIDPAGCTPSRPISMLEFHGTADETVPYEGKPGRYVSAEQAFAFWASASACSGAPELSYARGDASCQTYTRCAGGAEVGLCTIDEGGHTWPGGLDNFLVEQSAGKVSNDLSANDAIWSFFQRHPLPRLP
jgi:polyhydroxybutyrate depolymerase